jgi:hypothetical protein
MTTTEKLLLASIEILELRAENERLRWQVRLLMDMRRDLAEFEMDCDGPFLPPPFQRQAD